MASHDSNMQTEKLNDLKQDELVAHLVPDPANHEPVVALTGWLGKSTDPEHWRLYLTPALDEYVEFAASDVMYSQPLDTSQSALEGTMVWLKADTSLKRTQVVKQKVQAGFLQGDIASSYMAGSTPSLGSTSRQIRPLLGRSRGFLCSIRLNDACATNPFYCYQTSVCTAAECSAGC